MARPADTTLQMSTPYTSAVDPARDSYHHGDLRHALVDAGVELSRAGGADAVILREATRRTGVTARAAYRHFADREALLRAVAQAALVRMGATIAEGQSGVIDPVESLRRIGLGYLRFAWNEPGWFDTAFFAMGEPVGVPTSASVDAGKPAVAAPTRTGLEASPYRLLQTALAGLVAVGLLRPDRMEAAALLCWSGVHGFATLTARGPLASLPRQILEVRGAILVDDLVAAVISG
jgi:AcrR family transcriptional regulator